LLIRNATIFCSLCILHSLFCVTLLCIFYLCFLYHFYLLLLVIVLFFYCSCLCWFFSIAAQCNKDKRRRLSDTHTHKEHTIHNTIHNTKITQQLDDTVNGYEISFLLWLLFHLSFCFFSDSLWLLMSLFLMAAINTKETKDIQNTKRLR